MLRATRLYLREIRALRRATGQWAFASIAGAGVDRPRNQLSTSGRACFSREKLLGASTQFAMDSAAHVAAMEQSQW